MRSESWYPGGAFEARGLDAGRDYETLSSAERASYPRVSGLDPESRDRTVVVLERFCRRARALHAARIRVAATSAVRDASNRDDLERAVREHAGSDLEVITGEQEAALSFLGATRDLDAPPPFLVLDIGGGSTEFVVGEEEPEASMSTQMGSVRLTERLVRNDPPTGDELSAMSRATLAQGLGRSGRPVARRFRSRRRRRAGARRR